MNEDKYDVILKNLLLSGIRMGQENPNVGAQRLSEILLNLLKVKAGGKNILKEMIENGVEE